MIQDRAKWIIPECGFPPKSKAKRERYAYFRASPFIVHQDYPDNDYGCLVVSHEEAGKRIGEFYSMSHARDFAIEMSDLFATIGNDLSRISEIADIAIEIKKKYTELDEDWPPVEEDPAEGI